MSRVVPTLRTWSTNDISTAAFMNANVRDPATFAFTPPLARLTTASTQSIGNAATTGIAFDASTYDTDNGHSISVNNGDYFIQVGGYYRLSGQITYAANATGIRTCAVGYNGTAMADTQGAIPAIAGAPVSVVSVPIIQQCVVGDIIQIFGYQTSGGALATYAAGYCGMTVEWIHS